MRKTNKLCAQGVALSEVEFGALRTNKRTLRTSTLFGSVVQVIILDTASRVSDSKSRLITHKRQSSLLFSQLPPPPPPPPTINQCAQSVAARAILSSPNPPVPLPINQCVQSQTPQTPRVGVWIRGPCSAALDASTRIPPELVKSLGSMSEMSPCRYCEMAIFTLREKKRERQVRQTVMECQWCAEIANSPKDNVTYPETLLRL